MRLREIGWVICLAGLPWSFFLVHQVTAFRHLDLWHANTWWMLGWLWPLAALTVPTDGLGRLPSAFWWLVSWASLLALWMFFSTTKSQQPYPMALLASVGHLWAILLYLSVMVTWTPAQLSMILTALFWSGVGLIVYGGCQVAGLDQFFKEATPGGVILAKPAQADLLVGIIGNPTHFGCQLALWLPLAFSRSGRERWWAVPAVMLILVSQSATAVVVAIGFLGAWWWRQRYWRGLIGLSALSALGGIGILMTHTAWLNPFGRFQVWQAWWAAVQQRPMTGWGLGLTKQMAFQTQSPTLIGWAHLHNEYLQWWVETGLIGFALLFWAGWHCWQRHRTGEDSRDRWACAAMLVGCLAVGVLSFPWHLWQLGLYGLVGLAGWLILTEPAEAQWQP